MRKWINLARLLRDLLHIPRILLTSPPYQVSIQSVRPFKAIAAMSLNRVIGCGNSIPWHLPEDFRWFKQLTSGQVVVMGRKTFESIGRPLPNRQTVVLTRSQQQIPNALVLTDLALLDLEMFKGREVFICGGAEIYRQSLPLCSDLYLTLVKREVEGDTFFPAFEDRFRLVEQVKETADFEILHYKQS